MTAPMPLRDLLAGVAEPAAAGDIQVSGLNLDSRRVRPGEAFVALRGTREHGIRHAASAVANGAVVILADAPATGTPESTVPVLWVDGLRGHLGALAARFSAILRPR